MSIDGEVKMDDRERSSRNGDDRDPSPMRDERPRLADERARSRSPARNRSRSPRPRSPLRRFPGGHGGGDRFNNDDGESNPGNNLYVTNLSLRTRERDLEKLFGEYGKISKAAIMYDPHSQESRGFAFVSFDLPEDADNARAAISGKVELDGKVITVELAKRGRARTPTPGRYFGPPYRRDCTALTSSSLRLDTLACNCYSHFFFLFPFRR
ncbi:hypothetical protein BDZ88DRAFT_433754 [Geranomyces variabilis]|nr:hypothetical protein BDZ88DRAFT_433754 [Geranomyces variabilis]